jgi:hypothetical protein
MACHEVMHLLSCVHIALAMQTRHPADKANRSIDRNGVALVAFRHLVSLIERLSRMSGRRAVLYMAA